MAGLNINPLCVRIPFSHMAIRSFALAFKDYIHYKVYPNFSEYVFAPYQKVVQYSQQKSEKNLPDLALPLLNYDVQITGIDERVDGVWRSTNLTPALGVGVYPYFFKDDFVELRIMYRRMKGTISMNIFAPSYSNMIDIQTYFTDAFYGLNKFVTVNIQSYSVIPHNFTVETVYGEKIIKDIHKSGISKKSFKVLNRNAYYVPFENRPIMRLTSLSESMSYYSPISESYTLTGDLEFEIEMPQYIMALSNLYRKIIFGGITTDYVFDPTPDGHLNIPPNCPHVDYPGDDAEDNPDGTVDVTVPGPGFDVIVPTDGYPEDIIDNPGTVEDHWGIVVTEDDVIQDGEDTCVLIKVPGVLETQDPHKHPDNVCIVYSYIIKVPRGIVETGDPNYSVQDGKIKICGVDVQIGDLIEIIKIKTDICVDGYRCGSKLDDYYD